MLVLKNVKPTQVKIDNIRIIEFFDSNFIGRMNKEFNDLNFQAILMYRKEKDDDSDSERIAFLHQTKKDIENKILTVDAETPETLQKLLKVIEKYTEK